MTTEEKYPTISDLPDCEKSSESLTLSGIYISGRRAIALIRGQYVEIGDSVDGYEVKQINEQEVVIENALETQVLRMWEVPKL